MLKLVVILNYFVLIIWIELMFIREVLIFVVVVVFYVYMFYSFFGYIGILYYVFKFDVVWINIRNGYYLLIGIFLVLVIGVYVFYMEFFKWRYWCIFCLVNYKCGGVGCG